MPEMYYASFDTFLFCSCREGFGGGVLQAGAFGVPSIVSDIGPLKETIKNGEYGLFYKLGDYGDLWKNMELLYSNKDLVNEYGKKMQTYVQSEFDMTKWQKLYRDHVINVLNVSMPYESK